MRNSVYNQARQYAPALRASAGQSTLCDARKKAWAAPAGNVISETIGSWLERSEALIGVFALVIEFCVQQMNKVIGNATIKLAPSLFSKVSA